MYSRVFRKLLCGSANLRNKGVLENNPLRFPAITITVQKILPCVNYYCFVRHYSVDDMKLPKDPEGRKLEIDKRAQQKLDELLAKDPKMGDRVKILELEYTSLLQEGEHVPSQLRPRDWIELVNLNSRLQRKKFLEYLFKVEKQVENKNVKKEKGREMFEQAKLERQNSEKNNDTMIYGFGHNFMLRRISVMTMNKLWNWNALKATMYGNKIIYDCSYENLMNDMEIKSCSKQIQEAFAVNRTHNFPFEIFLCNVNFEGKFIEKLHRYIPQLFDEDCPFTVTPKSYLEYFEKSKLVYLTANSRSVLEEYDQDSVYIIGAYVDRGPSRPISLSKAKEDNIRTARLPLDRYKKFGMGSNKNLTLNQVLAIMLEAQNGNWEAGMENVPTRKLYESRLRSLENKVRKGLENWNLNSDFELSSNAPDTVNDFRHSERIKFRKP